MDEIERIVEVKNIPKQIYLQIGEEIEMDDVEDFKNIQDNYEITWCKDKINGNDIEFIHESEIEKIELKSLARLEGWNKANKRIIELQNKLKNK